MLCDRCEFFSVDMPGVYLRLKIRTGGQKSRRTQLVAITLDFNELLLARQDRRKGGI
jgi:hypothetical protein